MFRELVRKNRQLPMEDCIALLKSETRGVLSVLGDNDYPYGSPMNHFYNEDDGALYFHSGKFGHRMDAMQKHDKASFCVFDHGFRREGEWSLNVKSVIVFGRIELIDDVDAIAAITRKLSYKFTDDDAYIQKEIEENLHKTLLFRLVPEHISGKLVNEA